MIAKTGLFWRLIAGPRASARRLIFLVVRVALDRNAIDLAQPAAQIDFLTAATAKGHRLAGGGIELLFTDGTADHG